MLAATIVLACTQRTAAQDKLWTFGEVNQSSTALGIVPDAKSSALGDIGVATSPDNFSQYWNAAKYAQGSRASLGVSYVPWMRNHYRDINMFYAAGHVRFGKSSLSVSANYLSMGKVTFEGLGDMFATAKPWDMTFDVALARRLTRHFSVAGTVRYIRSAMSPDFTASYNQQANALAFDLSAYWQRDLGLVDFALGANFKNLGTKLEFAHEDHAEFLPASMLLGATVGLSPLPLHHVALCFQVNKRMVPSIPTHKEGESYNDYTDRIQRDYYDRTSLSAVFHSFNDSPGGFSEEMKEFQWSAGLEWTMFHMLSVRQGYHHESLELGNHRYYTAGVGLNLLFCDVNLSYQKSLVKHNPLDHTFRVDLAFKLP